MMLDDLVTTTALKSVVHTHRVASSLCMLEVEEACILRTTPLTIGLVQSNEKRPDTRLPSRRSPAQARRYREGCRWTLLI